MSNVAMTMEKLHGYLPQSTMLGSKEKTQQIIGQIVTDSRTIATGDFFVALSGDKFDGHNFLDDVKNKGALGSLISKQEKAPKDFPLLIVSDTKDALGKIAHLWRKELGTKLAVVTGSNGKTTVKEMIAKIFAKAAGSEKALSTKGNFNNEIGLPLTLLRLRQEHELAVIELGMNHPGETKYLAQIAAPNITLINNAQREHQEFMETVEAVAQEHALAIKALPADGIAIFPLDSQFVKIWFEAAGLRKVLTFGFNAQGKTFNNQHESFGTEKCQLQVCKVFGTS
jgi:UDP-N-acetylmuramoyl-tripeptide--D-alanyl-D-alanine ligase